MTARFALPWPNADIDIHPAPPEGWHRVAVVGGWQDAKRIRAKWPHAAVVSPLRTLRGIDLLARGLLANPQIRVLVWDGPDLTPGEETRKALFDLFSTDRMATVAEWAREHADIPMNALVDLLEQANGGVLLVDMRAKGGWPWRDSLEYNDGVYGGPNSDRPGGAIICPPPVPVAAATAPHGDPGDRVAGDTLADVWPRLLRGVLATGRLVPTQYGATRELLAHTTVVRDPASIRRWWTDHVGCSRCDGAGLDPEAIPAGPLCPDCSGSGIGRPEVAHPVLGISWAKVEAYAECFPGPKVGEGAPYSYGSRLRGAAPVFSEVLPNPGGIDGLRFTQEAAALDQVAIALDRLRVDPLDRAVFLSPWRPAYDLPLPTGGEPCLVGAWFRATPVAVVDADGAPCADCGWREMDHGPGADEPATRAETSEVCPAYRASFTLHLVTTWRSRDAYAAWPLNAAAACLWLVRTAEALGMAVGTYTDTSLSLHVYDRDWTDAQAVVDAYKPPSGPRWDQRTIWRVELVTDAPAVVCTKDDCECDKVHSLGQCDMKCGRVAVGVYSPRTAVVALCAPCHQAQKWPAWAKMPSEYPPAQYYVSLRATAYAVATGNIAGENSVALRAPPEGAVVAVIEANSPDVLCRRIAESGLVQEPSALLWLGTEIARVWSSR